MMNMRGGEWDQQKATSNPQFNQHQLQQQQSFQPQHMQQQQSPETREAMKYKVLQVSRVVVSIRESCQIVEDLLRAGQPIGFDGEGVNLGPKGQLTLVQISTFNGQVIIFDVQTSPALMAQGGLKKLLESDQIIGLSE